MESVSQDEIFLELNGQRLAGTVYRPLIPSDKGILFIHGWVSGRKNPAAYASNLAAKGYYCLTFDLRGMGDSEGDLQTLTRKDFLEDCLAAYDYLRGMAGIGSISVVGSSFGSYLACLLASKRPVESMVLRVPTDFTDQGFYQQPQIILSDLLDKEGLMGPKPDSKSSYALDALAKFAGKVLVVQSEKDAIVGPEMVRRFVDAVPKHNLTHVVMQGAPHSFSSSAQYKKEFAGLLDDWFADPR